MRAVERFGQAHPLEGICTLCTIWYAMLHHLPRDFIVVSGMAAALAVVAAPIQ